MHRHVPAIAAAALLAVAATNPMPAGTHAGGDPPRTEPPTEKPRKRRAAVMSPAQLVQMSTRRARRAKNRRSR